jgi:hypothetical protein
MLAIVAALAVAAGTPSCGAVPGAEALFAPDRPRIVWVGEAHGTAEQPQAFLSLVCLAERTGKPVIVALERDQAEQPLWNAFLASDGGPAAREALLTGVNWTQRLQDGRSSQAMLQLAEALRREHAVGRIATVWMIVPQMPPGPFDTAGYEAGMAREVQAAAAARPDAWVLAYSGNAHANKGENRHAAPPYRFAAATLPPEALTSVILIGDGGAAWRCQEDVCGPHDDGPGPHHPPQMTPSPRPTYDQVIHLGVPTHASPPAARPPVPEKIAAGQ